MILNDIVIQTGEIQLRNWSLLFSEINPFEGVELEVILEKIHLGAVTVCPCLLPASLQGFNHGCDLHFWTPVSNAVRFSFSE